MEEIEDALAALLSTFNSRNGRNVQIEKEPAAPHESGYLTYTLREKSRSLTLYIFDVVEPWGNVGLPEATAEIMQAMQDFWREGNAETARTVYIPPKLVPGVSN